MEAYLLIFTHFIFTPLCTLHPIHSIQWWSSMIACNHFLLCTIPGGGGSLYHNSLTNSFLLPITRLPALHRPTKILLILQHHLQQAFQLVLSLHRERGSPIHRTAIANQISRICSPLLMVSGISFQSCLSAIGQIPDGDHPMFCVLYQLAKCAC